MIVCEVGTMCIILIYIFIGAKCSVISSDKRKPEASDLCLGKRCGERCQTVSGKLQAKRYCQPDGSCGTDARPICAESRQQDPLLQIAQVIKKTLINKSTHEITQMMKEHFVIMKLINEKNIWASEKLANIGQRLLPGNIDGRDLCDFVDSVAEQAANNPYIVDFLAQVTEATYSRLRELVKSEGTRIFTDVVAFAMVLDRLTSAQKEDWRVMQDCQEIWDREISLEDIFRVSSPFEAAKVLTIDKCIDRLLFYLEHYPKVNPTASKEMRFLLSANILEAALEDLRAGFFANAKAGWSLVQNQDDMTGIDKHPVRASEQGEGSTLDILFSLEKDWTTFLNCSFQAWEITRTPQNSFCTTEF